jgi:hypothetical protein
MQQENFNQRGSNRGGGRARNTYKNNHSEDDLPDMGYNIAQSPALNS